MLIGGLATVIWDGWLRQQIGKTRAKLQRGRSDPEQMVEESNARDSIPLEGRSQPANGMHRRTDAPSMSRTSGTISAPDNAVDKQGAESDRTREENVVPHTDMVSHAIPVKLGLCIIAGFFGAHFFMPDLDQHWTDLVSQTATFIAILTVRGVLTYPPLALDLFANMYLAGTIIFGGGPVVIPLLREYVVEPGWVSSRDFLLGLAIIQAFPGPNFNFGVYLGALALLPSQHPTILGAFLGYVGIFVPGIALAVGVQSIWRILRTKPAVVSLLRGLNATAVGLVFTAVYRLWEIGYLTPEVSRGQSLALEPWWVVVAALTYAESAWFGVPPAAAIVLGAVLGLCWYGAVGR